MTDISLAMVAVRRADRVVLATLGLFAVFLLAVPGQAYARLVFTPDSWVFIAPFLLASLLVPASVPATCLARQLPVVLSCRPPPGARLAAILTILRIIRIL